MSREVKRWMLSLMRGQAAFLSLLAVLVCLSSVADVLVAYVLKLFSDAATNEAVLSLQQIIVLSAGVLVGVGATAIAVSLLNAKIQSRIEINIRQQILHSILDGTYSQVQRLHTADTLTKLTNDAQAVAAYYPRFITDILGGIFLFVLAVASLYLLNTKIALLITIVMPLLILGISLFNAPIGRADERQKQDEEKSRVLMQEYLDLNKLIKLFGIQKRCLSSTAQHFERAHRSKLLFGMWEGVASFLNYLTGNVILLITLGMGAYLAIKGETTTGTLIAMTQLFN